METSLWHLFSRVAAHTPQAPAVAHGSRRLSYSGLAAEAGAVAGRLHAAGVRPGDRVVLRLPRSADLVIAILAVSRLGAVVVPVAADLPEARVANIVDATRPAIVLTRLPAGGADRPAAAPVSADDQAYIVFTSGSSGVPKGVVVPNRGLQGLLATQRAVVPTLPGSRVLQFSSPGFDVLFWELSWSVLAGAELVVVPREQRLGVELATFLREEGITHAAVPPAVVSSWPQEVTLPAGMVLIMGGESCPPAAVQRWSRQCRVLNAYGPTETTVNATLWEAEPGWRGDAVPLGRPDPGKRILLLDEMLRPVPEGTVGEMFIAGAGVATGYLDDPEQTARRFLTDPTGGPGDRMYRTGDAARRDEDGTLWFHGRLDNQVQIRGHRVEPAEVERRLAAIPGVDAAVVVPRGNPTGGTELVAYVVARGNGREQFWRSQLADVLPAYLVPARFVALDALPLTTNDKVDRARLPEPADPLPAPEELPRTELERLVTEAFAEVLGVRTVGVHDDFFARGGDSIAAIVVVNRCRSMGLRRNLIEFHDRPTVAGVLAARDEPPGTVSAAEPVTRTTARVTPVMAHLLRRADSIDDFCQVLVVETPPYPVADIDRAWLAVTRRHDVLRSALVLPEGDIGRAFLRVAATGSDTRHHVVTRAEDSEGHDTSIDEAIRRLGPHRGVMASLRVRTRETVIAVHHLAVDMVSWHLLLHDFAALLVGDSPVSVPAAGFAHWSHALHEGAVSAETVAQTALWTAVQGPGDDLVDPLFPPDRRTGGTLHREIALSAAATAALTAQAESVSGLTLGHFALQALGTALRAQPAPGDPTRRSCSLLVEMESQGRAEHYAEGLDLAGMVGWFTSMFPFRVTAGGPDEPLLDGARRIRDGLARVPHLGVGYGLLRYLNPERAPELTALPVPPVLFNYLGQAAFSGLPPGWRVRPDAGSLRGGRDYGSLELTHTLTLNAVLTGGPDPVLVSRWSWRGLGGVRDLEQQAESVMRRWHAVLSRPAPRPAHREVLTPFGMTLTAADLALLEEER